MRAEICLCMSAMNGGLIPNEEAPKQLLQGKMELLLLDDYDPARRTIERRVKKISEMKLKYDQRVEEIRKRNEAQEAATRTQTKRKRDEADLEDEDEEGDDETPESKHGKDDEGYFSNQKKKVKVSDDSAEEGDASPLATKVVPGASDSSRFRLFDPGRFGQENVSD